MSAFQLFQEKKSQREKIALMTAYDFPTGRIVQEAGVDGVLVGDSLANVVLGLESTREVTMDQMLHHTSAVRRALDQTVLIGDMPYSALQDGPGPACVAARRFVKEAGCDGVKVEWFPGCLEILKTLADDGIPIMGHVGLTPQTADRLGGFRVQGRDADAARAVLKQARDCENSGCGALVVECVPDIVGTAIAESLHIPVIGIGAGAGCDGQILVLHDVIGLVQGFRPKFVRNYVNMWEHVREGVNRFCDDVRAGRFPSSNEVYPMNAEEKREFVANLGENT